MCCRQFSQRFKEIWVKEASRTSEEAVCARSKKDLQKDLSERNFKIFSRFASNSMKSVTQIGAEANVNFNTNAVAQHSLVLNHESEKGMID